MRVPASRICCVLLVAAAISGYGRRANADFVVDPFPPSGSGGYGNNDHTFEFGQDGFSDIYTVDSFFDIDGQDLNGATSGTAAQMGVDALPAGVDFEFASELSGDATDITLIYTWTNNTESVLRDITLVSFVDADLEISFSDDTAAVVGAPGGGESFEADTRGQLLSNVRAAALDGTNTATEPVDVAMALSFRFVEIADGQSVIMRVQLSEDGDFLSGASLHLIQSDEGPDTLTYSGAAVAGFVVDPFAAEGAGGSDRGHTFIFGQGGDIFQIDSLFNIGGQDLNGGADGTAARMGIDALPAGLDFEFSSGLSGDATDIDLTYTWTNNTGFALNDVTLLSFVDADIFPGFSSDLAAVVGAPEAGENFEVDTGAEIAPHALLAALAGTNAATQPSDVAMAQSFQFQTIGNGGSATMQVQLSADGDFLSGSSFRIVQSDEGPDTLTYSALAVPEPGETVLLAGVLLSLLALTRMRAVRHGIDGRP